MEMTCKPVLVGESPINSICISSIYWADKAECYVTSAYSIHMEENPWWIHGKALHRHREEEESHLPFYPISLLTRCAPYKALLHHFNIFAVATRIHLYLPRTDVYKFYGGKTVMDSGAEGPTATSAAKPPAGGSGGLGYRVTCAPNKFNSTLIRNFAIPLIMVCLNTSPRRSQFQDL